MYDLNVIPIHLQQGEQLVSQSGLHAAAPPRRAARSRAEDMLILSLITSGSDASSQDVLHDWLERLAQDFYKTSGSVTAALRTLIETLNLTLMEKNLKSAGQGGAVTGALNLAAIHRHTLYLAQSGPAHAYILTQQGLEHFYDSSLTDRGLGLSQTPTLRYYQASLGEGGYLFITDTPPETWSEELLLIGDFPDLGQLRRRLLNQAPADFRLDLVQMNPGEGQIQRQESAKPVSSTEPVVEQAVETAPSAAQTLPEPETEAEPDRTALGDTQEVRSQAPAPQQPVQPDNAVQQEVRKQRESGNISPRQTPGLPVSEPLHTSKEQLREKGLKGLAAFFEWRRDAKHRVGTFFRKLFGKEQSADSEGGLKLSWRTLLAVAVVIPLVVTAIAVGIYLARGRTMQYTYYYDQAVTHSYLGLTAEDPIDSRSEWTHTLAFLDQAESYRITDEATALREQAQKALDLLDGAVRLAYHPAIIGSFTSEINITQIVSLGTDLYLFDEAVGRVIHAERTSQRYEVDPEVVCAAGNVSGGAVGALVDMTPLPVTNTYNAHILAADGTGNIVYCAPGEDPVVQTLPISSSAIPVVKRIVYESGYLYVLDTAANTVRVYQATNYQFLDAPTDFFEGIEAGGKPDISQIVDLTVNGQELYLLREDGMLVDCVSSGLSSEPVICENPVTYVDGRVGKEDQAVTMPESNYISVLYTEPPEPAINVLDAVNADIYQFSLRFKLYQRLRPDLDDYEVGSTIATAFTIGIDRIAFLAFGNQVFYAYVE